MINMYSSVQDVLLRLLSERSHMRLLASADNVTNLFCDLVEIGLDFFELLRMFCDNDSFPNLIHAELESYLPYPNSICCVTEKDIHSVIPRWTGSKYHSATIDIVTREIYCHMTNKHIGGYVYHSNRNPQNIKVADDVYVLFVFSNFSIFLDLNRKKSYLFQEENYDKNSSMRR